MAIGRPKQEYCLKKKGPGIFYGKLSDWQNYISTGKTKKGEALRVILAWRDAGIKQKTKNLPAEVTLEEFTKDFFHEGSQYLTARQQKGKKISTAQLENLDGYLRLHILPQFGKKKLNAITTKDLNDYLVHLERSGETKNHILSTLNSIFAFAVEQNILSESPSVKIQRFAPNTVTRDCLTQEETTNLIPVLDMKRMIQIWQDPKWAALFSILATTGVRLGEALALTWGDILKNESGWYFPVAKSLKRDRTIGSTKTNQEGFASILEPVKSLLDHFKEFSQTTPKENELIFQNRDKRPIANRTVLIAFRRGLKNAGIELNGRNIVVHSLRHGFITLMGNYGADSKTISATTNHTNKKIIERYTHVSSKEKMSELEKTKKIFYTIFETKNQEQMVQQNF